MITRRVFLAAWQVLRSTVPLVLVPTTVEDGRGRPVRGLVASDFLLFDDDVPQTVYVEESSRAVSLVLAAQATIAARKPLGKLRTAISLFEPLVTGEGGEAAFLTIRDDVQLEAGFTRDLTPIVNRLRSLVLYRDGCSLVDAANAACDLLVTRPPERRRILVLMSEARDRTSKADLGGVLERLQREQVTVFALTYSPFLNEFGREAQVAP